MTDLFQFQPSQQGPWQFQPTLDGQQCTGNVIWNFFGQRYYLTLLDGSGNTVFTKALVGSPDAIAIQTLSWDGSKGTGTATVETSLPHNIRVGSVAEVTISGCAPDAFNGDFEVLAVGPTMLTYQLPGDPGNVTTLGAVSDDLLLNFGYFDTAIVFRDSTQTFEIG